MNKFNNVTISYPGVIWNKIWTNRLHNSLKNMMD